MAIMFRSIVVLILLDIYIVIAAGTLTSDGCSINRADIHFLLDSSGSVGSANFNKLKEFVAKFAQSLIIGPQNVQIGVTIFSTSIYPQFYMKDHPTQTQLVSAIKAIPYQSGGTSTEQGLKWVDQHAFTSAAGDRPGVDNILIVMTDGQSGHPPQTAIEAQKIHGHNIKVFAIGIGNGIKQTELDAIATDHVHTFTVQNFDALDNLQAALTKTSCKGTVSTTNKPTVQVSFTGSCEDSTFITCSDSHVCADDKLKAYCPITCGLCVSFTGPCEDSTFITCSDSHVCVDDKLKTYCPITCRLCVPTTQPPCEDSTFIQCSDSHVCGDPNLKTYCPATCGLCGVDHWIGIIGK